jgi:diaminopimelate decarboxylase
MTSTARSATGTTIRAAILRDGLLGGVAPEVLAERFGTPVYAYDLDVVTAQVTSLRAALPQSFDLAFAVKANPLLAVLQHLIAQGVGADVASGGELRQALRAGVDPGAVVFTGPGKRDEELEAAVDAGLRAVTVESITELRRLERIASSRGRCQPVMLRLNRSRDAGRERVRIIGDEGAGKFGMDLAELRLAAAEAVASPALDPIGIHAFGASNLLDAEELVAHVAATARIAAAVAGEAGFDLRLVDAGGGLGIPYADDDPALDLDALGRGLAGLAGRLAADPATAATRVLFEPGRYLVATAGAYVTRVIERKTVDGAAVAIVDGGIHHALRPALVGQSHRVVALTGAAAGTGGADGAPVTLAGPLCTGLDILAGAAPLGGIERGDLVAVLDLGAYGATESMPLFLSHPMPAEVVISGGEARLARPRIEPDTWLAWHVDSPGGL